MKQKTINVKDILNSKAGREGHNFSLEFESNKHKIKLHFNDLQGIKVIAKHLWWVIQRVEKEIKDIRDGMEE